MRSRSALLWALALGSTLLFGWLAVRGTNLDEILDALRDANGWWLVPSLAVLALGVFLRALRWQSLYPPETRPPLGPVTSAMLVGLAVNNLLPFRAGEAARIIALGRRAGTSRVESLATVALERVLDVFCLLLLLFLALPLLPDVTWVGGAAALAAALARPARRGGADVRDLGRPAAPLRRPPVRPAPVRDTRTRSSTPGTASRAASPGSAIPGPRSRGSRGRPPRGS